MSGDRNGDGGRERANGPVRHEKAASSINVRDFKTDTDDFEEWVALFEKAVKLATNVRDAPSLHYLYIEWLPLKLDNAALAILKQARKTEWPELKDELTGLLVDPQERYKWQAKLTTIKWDGKESFHTLASRVVRAVNKYDKEMPNEFKKREYYFRFRSAFKKPMRRFIDMGCPAESRNIDAAKEVALRYQLTTADEDDDGPGEKDALKAVAFAGANLHADRATSLETALAGITTQLENMSMSLRSYEDRLASLESDRRHGGRGNDFRSRDQSRGGQSRGYRDDSRGGYPPPRDRGYGRQDPSNNYGNGRRDSGSRQRGYSGERNNYRGNRDNSRGSYQNRPRDYSGGRNYQRSGRQESRDGQRNGQQGSRRDDRRDNRNDDRRDNRSDHRDDQRSDRSEDKSDDRRADRRNSRTRDAYRAIDTGDEASSDDSVADAEPRAPGKPDREN